MADDYRVTPASEWRKARVDGVPIKLPSGKVAALRAVSLDLLLRLGRIPDTLTPMVADVILGKTNDLAPETPEQLIDMMRLMDAVCEVAFVNPRIVVNPTGDDEIAIEDVEDADKGFVFGFLNQPTRALEQFRDQQARAVVPVDASEGNVPPTEPGAEPAPVGEA